MAGVTEAQARADTLRWLERAVIGLNLCPFAKAVHRRGQVHCAFHPDDEDSGLIDRLLAEAQALLQIDAGVRETTLLVAPNALADFLDFHAASRRAERALARAGFDGVLQLATFHPRFQFADAPADAIENATNRAPYPTLHLLREDSVSRAVASFPDAAAIYARNIDALRALGAGGWAALGVGASGAAR